MTHAQSMPGDEGAQPLADDLSESERYRLLANDRRRRAWAVVTEAEDDLGLAALAKRLTRTDADALDRERLELSLHHSHLPKLDDAGVLSYDPSTRTVGPRRA